MKISFFRFLKWVLVLSLITCTLVPLYYIIFMWIDNTPIVISHVFQNILFTLLATTVNTSAVTLFVQKIVNPRFPWQKNKTKRMTFELISTNIISILGSSVVFFSILFLFVMQQQWPDGDAVHLLNSWYQVAVISVIINTVMVSIYEGQFLLREWLKTKVEAEQLQREKAESQYAALKNQVNPHFLFNSLNSLSSLIRVSPDKAIEFVDKFSKIYRYVLDVNERLVVPIDEELKFLQSFFFLQTIRFGSNIQLNIHLDENLRHKYIVPLSLQLIIENAIKHNEISSEHPLIISIEANHDYLIVTNQIQPKTTMETSTGIGLKNLSEQYRHFTDLKPEFGIFENQYVAKIPLLEE